MDHLTQTTRIFLPALVPRDRSSPANEEEPPVAHRTNPQLADLEPAAAVLCPFTSASFPSSAELGSRDGLVQFLAPQYELLETL